MGPRVRRGRPRHGRRQLLSNPYQPPGSRVEGPLVPDPSPAPTAVTQAMRLLWTSFVLSTISLLPIIRPLPEDSAPELYWGLTLFFMGLFVAFVLYTARRRTWARWALLAYLALGWVNALFSVGELFGPAPLAAILDFVTMAIELRASYLLFTKASNDWFRTR